MREAELRGLLDRHLSFPSSVLWAQSHVMAGLGQRTVNEALSAGVPCKQVWRSAWAELELPDADL